MARLPQPGGDAGNWGDILNDYLAMSHKADGTIKDNAIGSAQLQDNSVTAAALAPNSINSTNLTSNSVNAAAIVDGTVNETKLATAVQSKLNAAPVIADGSITSPKIATNTVTKSQLSPELRTELDSILTASAFQALLGKLMTGLNNASIFVASDSTGGTPDSSTCWVTQWSTLLQARFPAYTFVVHFWSPASNSWTANATITLSGTGSKTVHVWNGTAPGQASNYILGGGSGSTNSAISWLRNYLQVDGATDSTFNYLHDLIIVSHGHNDGATQTQYNLSRDRLSTVCETILSVQPNAHLVITSQNPALQGGVTSNIQGFRADIYRDLAHERGFGFIDAYKAFNDTGAPLDYLDGTLYHPNAAGALLWAELIDAHAQFVPNMQPLPAPESTLFTSRKNLLVNGDFSDFASPPTLAGWTASNCTLTKQTGPKESKAYSLQMDSAAAGSASFIEQFVTVGSHLAGQWVTLGARFYIPSTLSGASSMCSVLITNTGYGGVQSLSYGGSGWRNGWFWASCSVRVVAAAPTLQIRIYNTGATTLGQCYVDRASLVRGKYIREGI